VLLLLLLFLCDKPSRLRSVGSLLARRGLLLLLPPGGHRSDPSWRERVTERFDHAAAPERLTP
jgi:hypothetical protein